MIPRYAKRKVDDLFSDEAKLVRWEDVELAVIKARAELGLTSTEVYEEIRRRLKANPPDVELWKKLDKELHHDFNAFVVERRKHLPTELQHELHKDMTSYDGEEAAFSRVLLAACELVEDAHCSFVSTLKELAWAHRTTLMLERTHGQWAKLRTFGGRVLTWLAEMKQAHSTFDHAAAMCSYSRVSGAIGNYGGGLTPEIEARALTILGLKPFLGATQIMPRVVFAPLAQSLQLHAEVLGRIALDIRLGARSGTPIYHEPFKPKQMGSSAMPHKKNTIRTEQMEGMTRLVRGYESSLVSSIPTWEARAIEQSCVERIAWPDLSHTILHMYQVMEEVVGGLVVYRDGMLKEIIESRGTYASDEAKNFLAAQLGKSGKVAEVAYRIVQIASFCVFKPSGFWADVRNGQYADMDTLLAKAIEAPLAVAESIQFLIAGGKLHAVEEIDVSPRTVEVWNGMLLDLFKDQAVREEWDELFRPSFLLKNETHLYDALLQ